METIDIRVHTADASQIEAIKAFMKALKIKFEMTKDRKPYDPEFINKIKQGDADLAAGKGRKVSLEELDNLWK